MAKYDGSANLKHFKKGVCPNPLGRGLSVAAIAKHVGENPTPEIILKHLASKGMPTTEKKIEAVLLHVLACKGLKGDTGAIKEFFDRRDGKARENVTLAGDPDRPIKLEWPTN